VEKSWSVALFVMWIVKMERMIRAREKSIVRILVTARVEMVNAMLEDIWWCTARAVVDKAELWL
jgi:hypothetical protein